MRTSGSFRRARTFGMQRRLHTAPGAKPPNRWSRCSNGTEWPVCSSRAWRRHSELKRRFKLLFCYTCAAPRPTGMLSLARGRPSAIESDAIRKSTVDWFDVVMCLLG